MTIGVGGSTAKQELDKLTDMTKNVQPITEAEFEQRIVAENSNTEELSLRWLMNLVGSVAVIYALDFSGRLPRKGWQSATGRVGDDHAVVTRLDHRDIIRAIAKRDRNDFASRFSFSIIGNDLCHGMFFGRMAR